MKTLISFLLLLICFTSESYAQSGWILWEKIYNISTKPSISKDEWRMIQAYPSSEVCQRQVAIIAESQAKHTKEEAIPGLKDDPILRLKAVVTRCEGVPNCVSDGYTILAEMEGQTFVIFHKFQCIPATFDPRKN